MTALTKEKLDASAVLTQALIRTATKLEINQKQLARTIGVDRSKISRMYSGDSLLRPNAGEWDVATAVIRIYRSLAGLLDGNETLMLKWFTSMNYDFGKAPREVLLEGGGAYRVVDYLDALRGRF
jgi:DNA-binding XRE family transcriptional regulator